jgi:serine/threonine kinase 38
LAIIGRGAFGEVRLCKHGKEIVAVKKMKKQDMINKNQVAHCKFPKNKLIK